MDDISQVVAAIIAKSEGVRSDGRNVSIIFYKPRQLGLFTHGMLLMPLPDLVRAVSRAFADESR